MKILLTLTFALIAALFAPMLALAGPDGVVTPADTIHPNIHQKVTANAATPNGTGGKSAIAGNGLHGIANVPGQSGERPGDDGVPGWANTLEDRVHGGIDSKNPVAARD